jgi:hypothetical protein
MTLRYELGEEAMAAWNCNEQPGAHAKRLFVIFAEGVAVAWFQKPSEFAVPCRPEHEIDYGLACDRIGSSAAARLVYPFRSNTGFKLYSRRQIKGLLE